MSASVYRLAGMQAWPVKLLISPRLLARLRLFYAMKHGPCVQTQVRFYRTRELAICP